MSTEIPARPVNWCPHLDRRRRRARGAMLVTLALAWSLWTIGGHAL